MADNILNAILGVSEGLKGALVPYFQGEVENRNKMQQAILESQLKPQKKYQAYVEGTPYGEPTTTEPVSIKTTTEKPTHGKLYIPYNEYIRRTKAGETFSSDDYQIVPQSYAGIGSPFVGIANQKQIKSYQNSLLSDPAIKELKDQGLSLQASKGLVDLAKQGNTVAFVSLGAKQARVMGERGMLTQSDVTRYVQSGSLSRQAGDKLLSWINGVPTQATLEEINQISNVLKTSFDSAVQPYIDKHATMMSEGLGIPIEDAYRYLAESNPNETAKPKKSAPNKPQPTGFTSEELQAIKEMGGK